MQIVSPPRHVKIGGTNTGLVEHLIPIRPDSTIRQIEHTPGANVWIAVEVDGKPYDLIMWKHAAYDEAKIATVAAAIATLKAAAAELAGQ